MAGDWIKMRTALAHDPAVIAIALDLDKSEFEIVGMLHHLWSWADSQSQDGHIKRVTEKWIDRYVHHQGFAKAMSDAGWLVIENDGITFPNFDRHNGDSAKRRAEAAERKRISRDRAGKFGAENVTDMSHISCDESVTREEKRREEDKDQKHLSPDKPDDAPKTITKKVELTNEVMEKIMARYNAICGHSFKGAAELTSVRKKNLAKCWARKVNGKLVFQSGKFWEEYFTWCLRDPHWHGEAGKAWKASMEFVTRHDIVDRVIDEMILEGVFENGDS